MPFDAHLYALSILATCIEECLMGIAYFPKNEREAYETTLSFCSDIIAAKLIEKEITFSEMYAVNNELGKMLFKAFENQFSKERK